MTEFYPLIEARTRLLSKQVFFARLLYEVMDLKVCTIDRERGPIPTCATDGRTIFVNPEFFESLTVEERVFAFCHEIMHAICNHMPRMDTYRKQGHISGMKFSPMLYNIAADYVINAALVAGKIGKINPNWLLDKKYDGTMLVEDVYADLYKTHKDSIKEPGGQGEGPGSNDGQGGSSKPGKGDQSEELGKEFGGEVLDKHLATGKPEASADNIEFRQAVAAAYETAKACGNMPGGIENIIESFLDPQIDWRERLQMFVHARIGNEVNTWRRPARRPWQDNEEYWPSKTGYAVGTVVAAFDTSGSVSTEERQHYMAELQEVCDSCHPEELIIIWCDTEVRNVIRLTTSEIASFDVNVDAAIQKGGGGTYFHPPFNWVENNDVRPSAFIYFTDGICSFPDEPDYDVLWCITTPKLDAPWGTTVHVHVD